jgi:lysophospholipase L1-like esterase
MLNTIVGFGASSMQGVGDSQGGFFARAEKLAAGKRMRWINRGVGGNTTRDMLLRVTTVTVHSPHRLVVLLGCNDMPRGNDPQPARRTAIDEYAANLRKLLPRIAGTPSLFVTSFPVSPAVGISDATFSSYMTAAVAAATDAGYAVWDLYAELKDLAQPFWAPDGVHFNDAGHAYIADRFVEAHL